MFLESISCKQIGVTDDEKSVVISCSAPIV